MGEIKGVINSFQSMGAVDGPGVRFVIFMQGCPLRCVYCHNPETWKTAGEEFTVDDVVRRALRYRPYFGDNGGVTVSGGEALLQAEFVTELFGELKKYGIHTCLDTSGCITGEKVKALLNVTDLVICDLKFATAQKYKVYSGGSLDKVLSFMKECEKKEVPMWVRHVVVPGLTDSEDEVKQVKCMAQSFKNLERFELLPFRKLCITKYDALGIRFPLESTPACEERTIKSLQAAIL